MIWIGQALLIWMIAILAVVIGTWFSLPVSGLLIVAVLLPMLAVFFNSKSAESIDGFLHTNSGTPAWAGHVLYSIGAIGIVAAPLAILTDNNSGLLYLPSFLCGMALFSATMAAPLVNSGERSLADLFRREPCPRLGGVALMIGVFLFGFMILQFSLAAIISAVVPGISIWLVMLLVAALAILMALRSGNDSLRQAELIMLLFVFGIFITAVAFSKQTAGVSFPLTGWGFLSHDMDALARKDGSFSGSFFVSKGEIVQTIIALSAGLAMIPAMLWSFNCDMGTKSGSGRVYLIAFLILTAMPVFAYGLAAQNGWAAYAGASFNDALKTGIETVSFPLWLVAVLLMGAIAICAAGAAKASIALVMATGRHLAPETAGSSLLRSRTILVISIVMAALASLLLPAMGAKTVGVLLTVLGASLFAPLFIYLHWQRSSVDGVLAGMLAGMATAVLVIANGYLSGSHNWFNGVYGIPVSAIATMLVSLASPPVSAPTKLLRID